MFEGHLKVLQLFTGEPLNDGSVCRTEDVQRWLRTTTGWSFRALKRSQCCELQADLWQPWKRILTS